MKIKKINYKLFILLYAFWILLTLNFQLINLIVGCIASIIVTIFSYGVLFDTGSKFKFPKALIILRYILILIFEIYKSSFSHMLRIIKKDCNPIIVEVKLDLTDPFLITLISNSITLTPGTITVDTDKNKLTVLSIKDYGENGNRISKDIKEKFEKLFI